MSLILEIKALLSTIMLNIIIPRKVGYTKLPLVTFQLTPRSTASVILCFLCMLLTLMLLQFTKDNLWDYFDFVDCSSSYKLKCIQSGIYRCLSHLTFGVGAKCMNNTEKTYTLGQWSIKTLIHSLNTYLKQP